MMLATDDTIVAPAGPAVPPGRIARSIIRIAGPEAISAVGRLCGGDLPRRRGVIPCRLALSDLPDLDAVLYVFVAPHSYTGDDLVEIHLVAAACVIEHLVAYLTRVFRLAQPGEFTRRAFFNGRMDLAQAEAVAQIVTASNHLQLAAAENLYAGRLGRTVGAIRGDVLDLLARIEADLDFADEEIDPLDPGWAVEQLDRIHARLTQLRRGSLHYEGLIDLPAVGLAGAPNAGKSTLLNRLLGAERSIVSAHPATTRDVLSGVLELTHLRCALFDCAGLAFGAEPEGPLDTLARQAARQALAAAELVIFCVDASKPTVEEDRAIRAQLPPRRVLYAATQCDRLDRAEQSQRLADLGRLFDADFLPVSAHTGAGLDELRRRLEECLASPAATDGHDRVTVNQRHRRCVEDAGRALEQARGPLLEGRGELAAVHLREAAETLARVESEPLDELVLDRIFARFCVGK